jgi:hypothetical protein
VGARVEREGTTTSRAEFGCITLPSIFAAGVEGEGFTPQSPHW